MQVRGTVTVSIAEWTTLLQLALEATPQIPEMAIVQDEIKKNHHALLTAHLVSVLHPMK